MVYEPLYHAGEIATIKLSSGYSCKAKSADLARFLDCFFLNKTNIPLTVVGYEMIANSAFRTSLTIYHLTSNARARTEKDGGSPIAIFFFFFFEKFVPNNIMNTRFEASRTFLGVFMSVLRVLVR